jgi:elongation factor P
MISANDLRKGATYTEAGDLFKVLDFSHNKTARGGATIRVKVSNLRSGAIFEKTYNGGERVQDIRLDHSQAQYLYNDGDLYYFMDNQTFEQPAINREILEEIIPFLTENLEVKISSYEGEPIDIEIPVTVDLEVVETEPGFAGDTAQGATKPAKLSTGLVVQTPLFVNIGDMIRVDTRTGAYVTRVS